MINQYTVISDDKLICANSKYKIFSRGEYVYVKEGKEKVFDGKFELPQRYKLLVKFKIFQRLFRLEARCGVFADEETVIIAYHGAIYRINLKDKLMFVEHRFRMAMNNPLSFCSVGEGCGIEKGILYGEYFGNHNRDSVNIFYRNESGDWTKIYAFKPGEILHVHSIMAHSYRKSIIILTGDEDNESGIWETTDGFATVKKIVGGKQIYRACVSVPYKNGIVYVTDTPLEENGVYYINLNNYPFEAQKLCTVAGPAIYGKLCKDGRMVFSTSVEPDSRISPYFRYAVSMKAGPGVKDMYSHIYQGSPEEGFKEVLAIKKDKLPMLLFGFGTFQFPECEDFIVTIQSLMHSKGRTLKLN